MALISVQDVIDYGGLPTLDARRTASASAIIDGLQDEIEDFLGRGLESASYTFTDQVDHDFDGRVFLPRAPVTAVSSVTIDGTTVATNLYNVHTWGISHLTPLFSQVTNPPTLVVSYTAGYAEGECPGLISSILTRAALQEIQAVALDGASGTESVSTEGQTVRYANPDGGLSDRALRRLSKFRRRGGRRL